jgi:choline dehydrogenase-like flavoprotein
MSIDPTHGVVDADLRVHGTDNVYVCSTSAFPNITAVPPTLTRAAIALRLGDHLAGKLTLRSSPSAA